MIDVADLKTRTDLVAIVEADLGQPRRHNGRWLSWPCPFHADSETDGGSLRVTPDTQTWFCFGCRETGDVIAWIMKRQNVNFQDACKQLGAEVSSFPRVVHPVRQQRTTGPDSSWQATAEGILKRSQDYLWGSSGTRALDYLRGRGLQDATIKQWELGYNPCGCQVGEILSSDGKPAFVGRGHVIPVRENGNLVLLKIRQPDGFIPRYTRLVGGKTILFGTETLANRTNILLTEGEFDAMLAYQEASAYFAVASTTGGCKVWQREWLLHLLGARQVLVAYDNDDAGNEAADSILKLSPRMRRVRVPSGKDITEYHQAGGNIRTWLEEVL